MQVDSGPRRTVTGVLVAKDAQGKRTVATPELRGTKVACPSCGEYLIVRVPSDRVAHFAHPPGRRCSVTAAARRAAAKQERERAKADARLRQMEMTGQVALFGDEVWPSVDGSGAEGDVTAGT